jgi:hypothetical protein
MNGTRWVGGIAASVVAVGALALGGGSALADTGTPAPEPAAGSNEKICNERIPQLLAKIDRVTERINADETTVGSTAWLRAKEGKARSSGRTVLADLIQLRISHRPERLEALTQARDEVENVRTANCTS